MVNGQSVAELLSAKEVMASFLLAWQNRGLYPEDNQMASSSLAQAKARLDEFLAAQINLKVEVDQGRLLFEGEVIHEGPPHAGNLAHLLFREGIKWLQFREGIETEELTELFSLTHHYRSCGESLEGDLVTAMWERSFPHVSYEAADVLGSAEVLLDASQLCVKGPKGNGPEQPVGTQSDGAWDFTSEPDASVFKLTAEEQESLDRMVLEAEARDGTDEIVDVLLILLEQQDDEETFAIVLDHLKSEFVHTLREKNFHLTHKLLTELLVIRQSSQTAQGWAVGMVDDFLKAVASPESLEVLAEVWPACEGADTGDAELLESVLHMLGPEIILTLVPMLNRTSSQQCQLQIMNIITTMAARDLSPLEKLLEEANQEVAGTALHILGQMTNERSMVLLVRLLRHNSASVRQNAIEAMAVRGHRDIKDIFRLVEDPVENLCLLALEYIGRQRSRQGEDLLLDYLRHKRFARSDGRRLMACYRTLGRCGSSRSWDFLREMILARVWIPGSVRSLHRQGALAALRAIDPQEAQRILEARFWRRLILALRRPGVRVLSKFTDGVQRGHD